MPVVGDELGEHMESTKACTAGIGSENSTVGDKKEKLGQEENMQDVVGLLKD